MKQPKVPMADDEPLNTGPGTLSKDYDAIKASGGIDLQIKVEKTLPDFILLNTMISNKNGCAVCRELKTNHKTRFIPILL
ncbi:response regulator [Candidatus Methanoperedens nitratireducens]|uniref:Response regulator receiver modulated metal dependent phosphohydrolase n=1 Tax=Candidatus Methanoperedens nitratireducens TaxID=1392998 RepID=A0A284VRM1_9EURY